ncbi:MAG: DUF882 domain-containing protein [Proteobacteria bacterium]|nr:DUF882 domain-containing protein [Pseudomonadota bacterium]
MAFLERYSAAVGSRRLRALLGTSVLAGVMLASTGTQDAIAVGETRSLTMVHSHTGETISITYKSGGSFNSSALEKLNWFLRDWRVDEPIAMSPNLFDIVWHVYREVGATEPIKIMSAYRSPGTNAMLRRRSRAVAKESQHMRGNAMDIHIPGVSVAKVREIGLRLQRGGVGYYPSAGSPFVHLDVGSVRHWPKMSRDALERIFPDGKTVHIPADGKPLANYESALAEVQARGGSALDYATVTSGKSFWALLFGGGEEGEDEAITTPARGRGRGAATRVADARGARSAPGSSVSAFAGGADNPMNPGFAPPAEAPASRPVAVASLPQAVVEPPRQSETRTSGLRELDTKGDARQDQLPRATGLSRFEPVGNVPLPPIRPRGAAFTAMVASIEPSNLPLPPQRPGGLGAASGSFALASASSVPAPAAPAAVTATLAAVSAPLPPARPEALRTAALPGVLRGGEGKMETVVQPAAHAYAAVSAPLPPQRHASVTLPVAAPKAQPVPAAKIAVPPPALDAGRANARAAGQKPLAVPPVVAARPAEAGRAPAGQDFAAQKYMPSLGFSGSFVREIDASGGFTRLGR